MYKVKDMKPIVLNEYGDTLREYPHNETTWSKQEAEKNPDNKELSSCIGVHDICRGWMDIKQISQTHQRITCRACSFTMTIPLSIDTYGKLRKLVTG